MDEATLRDRITHYFAAWQDGRITELELEAFLQALQRMCRPQLRVIQGGRA